MRMSIKGKPDIITNTPHPEHCSYDCSHLIQGRKYFCRLFREECPVFGEVKLPIRCGGCVKYQHRPLDEEYG